jgi:senataxin
MTMSEQEGIYLIHGPPGSGKTTTIVNLLSAYFHVNVPGMQPLSEGGRTTQKRNSVLICTPSNAAVDEIIKRLDATPIPDKDDRPRTNVRRFVWLH